ncbi:cytochrome c oxidase assembly protein [Isoptericola sp. AK164]|uniref:cytochrome c oxidase assembly protein n=1 Tax=Isoptericola sp. AK164 TaxID=3024246 RepID=UPI0024186026|nr:cytochrome c oxidase assembly protein [Isoptericola sp. AK164]
MTAPAAPTTRPAPAPTSARPWWLIAAGPGAVVVALLALLAAGSYSGAFDPLGTFSDPGPAVRWGLPAATVLSELALAVTVGGLFAVAFLLPRGRHTDRVLLVAGWASSLWAVAAVVQLVLSYSYVSTISLAAETFGQGLWQFVLDVELGQIGLWTILLAAVTSALALGVRGPVGALWTAVLPGAALALQSTTGHAAGAVNHDLAVGAMLLHLVGAALWVGGLAALLVVVLTRTRRRRDDDLLAASAVARFSPVAAWCFVLVALSGLMSALIRMQHLDDLVTRWGVLLQAKVLLLLALGAFGWAHRRWVVGRLATDPGRVRRLFWQLLAAELVTIGAVSGVAVALGSTAPPVPDEELVDASPAFQLTGYALPPENTLGNYFTQWSFDPLFAVASVAGALVYVTWALRLRRRGDRWPLGRTISWCAGMAIMVWVTNGGPSVYGHVIFSGHMTQHMILAMVVPLLLVLAAPVTLLLRAVPARKDGSRGPREWVLAIVHSRVGSFVAKPVVAAVVFAGGMIAFYFTPVFGWALSNHAGHVWMIIHFTLAGYLFANALVGIDPGPQRPPYPQRLLLLFATMVFHAFFGVVLTTGTSLLVADWFGNMGRPWGLPAIDDQQLGGAIAWGIGELPTLVLAVVVGVQWARSDEREARRSDRRAERDDDAELRAYNRMLADMAERDGRD